MKQAKVVKPCVVLPVRTRLETVAGAGKFLFSRLLQAPGLPREGLCSRPSSSIDFLAHIAAVMCGGH